MDPKRKDAHKQLADTSNCALQIALQTMKDRCQQLQLRLSNLEDENLKLRIDKRKHEPSKEPKESILSKLNEEVEILTHQKSQLTHHIFMVATENKHLWTKLSLLTEEGNENCKVPEQSISLMKDKCEDSHTNLQTKFNTSPTLDQPKSEIKDAPSMKDFEFNLSSMMSSNGGEDNNFEIHELGEELNQTKVQLRNVLTQFRNQQSAVKAGLEILLKAKKDKENNPPSSLSSCPTCQHKKHHPRGDKTYKVNKPSSQHLLHEIDILAGDDSMVAMETAQHICPMCKHVETQEQMFVEHVFTHFQEAEPDEALSVGNPLPAFLTDSWRTA